MSDQLSLNSLLDWLHWGVIISTVFFGFTALQGWLYFNDNNDGWHLRLLVMILIIFDLATTCLNSVVLRDYSTSNWTLVALVTTARIFDVQVALSSVVVFLVELFFASRVYLLDKKSWYAPALIVGCAIGAQGRVPHVHLSVFVYELTFHHFLSICDLFVDGFVLADLVFNERSVVIIDNVRHNLVINLSSRQLKLDVGISVIFSAIADLVTTIALCWKLSTPGTGARRTQTVLHQLLLYFITRGVLVTLVEVAHVIIYEIQAKSLHWLPLQLVSCKLYVNTTLAILNARTSLRVQMDTDAMHASRCMPSIRFEDRYANQRLHVEDFSFTNQDKQPGVLGSSGSTTEV